MLNSSVHYQNASCIYLGNLSAAAIRHCCCARTLFEMKLAFPRSLKIYYSTIQLKHSVLPHDSAGELKYQIFLAERLGRRRIVFYISEPLTPLNIFVLAQWKILNIRFMEDLLHF